MLFDPLLHFILFYFIFGYKLLGISVGWLDPQNRSAVLKIAAFVSSCAYVPCRAYAVVHRVGSPFFFFSESKVLSFGMRQKESSLKWAMGGWERAASEQNLCILKDYRIIASGHRLYRMTALDTFCSRIWIAIFCADRVLTSWFWSDNANHCTVTYNGWYCTYNIINSRLRDCSWGYSIYSSGYPVTCRNKRSSLPSTYCSYLYWEMCSFWYRRDMPIFDRSHVPNYLIMSARSSSWEHPVTSPSLILRDQAGSTCSRAR